MAEYIEREALIRYTEKQEVIIVNGTSIADAMRIQGNVFRKCIETAPAADVAEVKHGHWIRTGAYVCGEYEFKCSVCKNTNWHTSDANEKYCQYCGAKMDGDGE